jgi:transcriptional regulator with XRE-family HTH domain
MRAGVPRAASPQSLGAALRALRESLGRTVRETADELKWSGSKLSRIETDGSRVKSVDLARLLDFYGVSDEERERIGTLAQQPTSKRQASSEALPDAYQTYADLEARATSISMYGAIVVPGLLQTEEYAAAVIGATPTPEEHFAEERMARRMVRRGLVLGRQPPPSLNVVIDEAVLRRPIGSAAIMRRQVLRLRELNERDNISIRVLPFKVGAHPALTGPFAILDFAEGGGTDPHVFCDGLTGGVLRTGSYAESRYRSCFSTLLPLTLDSRESAEFFAALVKD